MKRSTVPDAGALPSFTPDQARALKPIFRFLNDKDLDILYLIFVSRKRQVDVQVILNRTQPSLVYDIKRIRRRLQFIHYLNSAFDIFLNFIEREQGEEHFTPNEIEILTLMFYTSSFTLTGQVLGISQVKVRHSYTKSLRRMEELAEECLTRGDKDGASDWFSIYEIFSIIRSNLNIVRRLYGDTQKRKQIS
jgi:hypothetical protein